MGRAELNLFILLLSRRKSFLQGKEFCLSAHSVIGSRARGERVLGAGRSNHGRGAMTIKEEGTTFCAFRNNF